MAGRKCAPANIVEEIPLIFYKLLKFYHIGFLSSSCFIIQNILALLIYFYKTQRLCRKP